MIAINVFMALVGLWGNRGLSVLHYRCNKRVRIAERKEKVERSKRIELEEKLRRIGGTLEEEEKTTA